MFNLNPRTKNALYVLIFTVIAVLGAYFLITEINKMSQDSNESILSDFWQKKKPNQAEVTDIKDWKTYRNEEYGFEFALPLGWIQNGEVLISEDGTILIDFASPEAQSSPQFDFYGGYLNVNIYRNLKELSVRDFYVNELKWDLEREVTGGLKEIEIDSKRALRLYNVVGLTTSEVVAIEDGKRLIEISDLTSIGIIDQILSTFKFIK